MKTTPDSQTFTKYTVLWYQNYITLRQLAFIRAMDRFDIHAANIACAQKDWAESRLSELVGKESSTLI